MKTNPYLQKLIPELKKLSNMQKVNIWKRIAHELESSTSKQREVNLGHLDKHTKNNETVIVPGKVLGAGELQHPVTIAAFKYSAAAKEKLLKTKCTVYSIEELLQKNPKGSNVRILG
ncbi:50S ribosomal protein L18e [Candidatus Woesearchaeota archaeon]|nr:50S ribosomal protein L18e [Candidatus Woesearchaeota archaeon]